MALLLLKLRVINESGFLIISLERKIHQSSRWFVDTAAGGVRVVVVDDGVAFVVGYSVGGGSGAVGDCDGGCGGGGLASF